MAKKAKRKPKPAVSTTGSHLHALIKEKIGADYKPGCGCREVVNKMNAHSSQWSLDNMTMIVGKMRASAKQYRWWSKVFVALPGSSTPLRWMVQESVRLAEQDAAASGQ